MLHDFFLTHSSLLILQRKLTKTSTRDCEIRRPRRFSRNMSSSINYVQRYYLTGFFSVPFLRKRIKLKAHTSIQITPEDQFEVTSFQLTAETRELIDASSVINSNATTHNRTVQSIDYTPKYYLREPGLELRPSTGCQTEFFVAFLSYYGQILGHYQ